MSPIQRTEKYSVCIYYQITVRNFCLFNYVPQKSRKDIEAVGFKVNTYIICVTNKIK